MIPELLRNMESPIRSVSRTVGKLSSSVPPEDDLEEQRKTFRVNSTQVAMIVRINQFGSRRMIPAAKPIAVAATTPRTDTRTVLSRPTVIARSHVSVDLYSISETPMPIPAGSARKSNPMSRPRLSRLVRVLSATQTNASATRMTTITCDKIQR